LKGRGFSRAVSGYSDHPLFVII